MEAFGKKDHSHLFITRRKTNFCNLKAKQMPMKKLKDNSNFRESQAWRIHYSHFLVKRTPNRNKIGTPFWLLKLSLKFYTIQKTKSTNYQSKRANNRRRIVCWNYKMHSTDFNAKSWSKYWNKFDRIRMGGSKIMWKNIYNYGLRRF